MASLSHLGVLAKAMQCHCLSKPCPKFRHEQLTESNRQIAEDKEVPMIYLGLQEIPAT